MKEYFIKRDQGWLSSQSSLRAGGGLREGAVAAQPLRAARRVAEIAEETEKERGLRAEKVLTGFAEDNLVEIQGHTATATVTTGTFLDWNDKALGVSQLGDTYIVRLERKKQTWRIVEVTYAPVPSTDINEDLPKAKADHPAPQRRTVPEKRRQVIAGTYNREAASAYASYWAGEWRWSPGLNEYVYTGGNYNPDYQKYDNDCANLVSQALHAGGWPKRNGSGWSQDPSDPNVWSDNVSGIYGPAWSWTRASSLHDYAANPARGEAWKAGTGSETQDIWKLRPGDLLFTDWDPNGVHDGRIDHAMFISGTYTELGFTEPTYSQHSPHRQNLPLSIGIKIATSAPPPVDPGNGMGGQGRKVIFHPVHVKDTFTD